jgi:two-component system, LytTR family, response regulator
VNIRTLIVDDESRAREGISLRLEEYSAVTIIGESSSGLDAVEKINTLRPDLLFLDIQMPELNGFEVLRRITVDPLPMIIFVTAYDTYAVRAFEFHALDYLLKPINDERFRETVQITLAEFKHRNLEKYAEKLKSIAGDYLNVLNDESEAPHIVRTAHQNDFPDRFFVKTKGIGSFVSVGEIDWIESAGDYVYLHSNAKKYLIRETMKRVESKLNPKKFVRIHRAFIVNVDKIKSLHPNTHGDYEVILAGTVKLKLSRKYREKFQSIVGNPL